MAVFPGTGGENILAWRGVSETVNGVRERLAEKVASLPRDSGIDLLRGFEAGLKEEVVFEEDFSTRFDQLLADIANAEGTDDFIPFLPRFNGLAGSHFGKRGSAVAINAICTTFRDSLLKRCLERVEQWLQSEGLGLPPSPYCCLAGGSLGRGEPTLCVNPWYAFIYGDDGGGLDYFKTFTYRALAFLEKIGLLKEGGKSAAMKSFWRGSRTQWREEIVGELIPQGARGLMELVRRVDLRLVSGDVALAGEMTNLIRSMLEFHHGGLRETTREARTRAVYAFPLSGLRDLGKGISEMPTGLDFFSRLRVAKSGRHRGEFNLQQYALDPLISNVRMLAVNFGLHETGTVGRLKGLLEQGRLGVDLTERLLVAYHDFTTLKIAKEIAEGCVNGSECYIDTRRLCEADEYRLRNSMEAVSGLAKIVYLSFTEME